MCIRDRVDPWSREREVARSVLRFSPKPEKVFFFCHRRVIEIFFACFLHSSAQMCLYQTRVRRPPRITGHFVSTVTRGWVGAPKRARPVQISWRSRWFCRSMSVEDSYSRNSNQHLAEFFSGRSWPNICPGTNIFVVFSSLELFF